MNGIGLIILFVLLSNLVTTNEGKFLFKQLTLQERLTLAKIQPRVKCTHTIKDHEVMCLFGCLNSNSTPACIMVGYNQTSGGNMVQCQICQLDSNVEDTSFQLPLEAHFVPTNRIGKN